MIEQHIPLHLTLETTHPAMQWASTQADSIGAQGHTGTHLDCYTRVPENDSYEAHAKKASMWAAIGGGAMAGGMVGSLATPVGTVIGAGAGAITGYQAYKQLNKHTAKQQKSKQQNTPPKNILQEPAPQIDNTPLFKPMPELDALGESDLNNYTQSTRSSLQGATTPPTQMISDNSVFNQNVNINVNESVNPRVTAQEINNSLMAQASLNGIQYRNQATV